MSWLTESWVTTTTSHYLSMTSYIRCYYNSQQLPKAPNYLYQGVIEFTPCLYYISVRSVWKDNSNLNKKIRRHGWTWDKPTLQAAIISLKQHSWVKLLQSIVMQVTQVFLKSTIRHQSNLRWNSSCEGGLRSCGTVEPWISHFLWLWA